MEKIIERILFETIIDRVIFDELEYAIENYTQIDFDDIDTDEIRRRIQEHSVCFEGVDISELETDNINYPFSVVIRGAGESIDIQCEECCTIIWSSSSELE